MLSYHRLKHNPRVLRALTSLDPEEFDTLLLAFQQAWDAHVSEHYRQKESRKRRYGGGRKPRLVTIEDKLLFILLYFKVYPLQEVIAQLFGMSQGRANEWIHTLSPLLERALGEAHCLPERDPQHLKQVLALCASVNFVIDGTERPVQRPTAPIEQKDQYSGKKRHTVKNTLIADVEECLVRYLSETYPGRIHDKRIGDLEEPGFPPDINLFQDTGFQGYHPPGVTIYQPKKKPKGGELTAAEKAENTLISSIPEFSVQCSALVTTQVSA
jgi:hypothetical protein